MIPLKLISTTENPRASHGLARDNGATGAKPAGGA